MPELCNISRRVYDGIGRYDIPCIAPVDEIPKIDRWIEFEVAKKKRVKNPNEGVHFFEEDSQFETIWNFPDRYGEALSKYGVVIMPDFSTYLELPKAVRIYQKYRMHWIGAYWQEMGLTIIPTIRTGLEEDWKWTFDGYPTKSIVAVSNVGCNQILWKKREWIRGYYKMLELLEPTKILFYSNSYPEGLDGNIEFIKYNIRKSEERKEIGGDI